MGLTPDLLIELKNKGYNVISMGHAYRINGSVDIFYNGRTVYDKANNNYLNFNNSQQAVANALIIADKSGKIEAFKKTVVRKRMSYQEFNHKKNAPTAEYYHWDNNKDVSDDCLYFIQSGIYVKIGRSENPIKRIKEISTGSPEAPKLLCYIKNMGHMEKKMHLAFSEWRIRENGEWFYYGDPIKNFINFLKTKKNYYNPEG